MFVGAHFQGHKTNPEALTATISTFRGSLNPTSSPPGTWNMPADYEDGIFESCDGDAGDPMCVYGTSTWYQVLPTCEPVVVSDVSFKVTNIDSSLISITPCRYQTIPSLFSTNQKRNNGKRSTRNRPIGPRGWGHSRTLSEVASVQEKRGSWLEVQKVT